LRENLEIHFQKSRIISLSKGIDFVGFKNFYYYKLARKRNIRKMEKKIKIYENGELKYREIMESYQGWQAYSKWANTLKLRKRILKKIYRIKKSSSIDGGDVGKHLK